MRTHIQIENLRKVFLLEFGLVALLYTDEMIDTYADRLQQIVDATKATWEIRVRVEGDNRSWTEIECEPGFIIGSVKDVSDTLAKLLNKFDRIQGIEILEHKFKFEKHYIERNELSEN